MKKVNLEAVGAVVVLFGAFWDPFIASLLAIVALAVIAFSDRKVVEWGNSRRKN